MNAASQKRRASVSFIMRPRERALRRRRRIVEDLDEAIVAVVRPYDPTDGDYPREGRHGLRGSGKRGGDANARAFAGRRVMDVDARRTGDSGVENLVLRRPCAQVRFGLSR